VYEPDELDTLEEYPPSARPPPKAAPPKAAPVPTPAPAPAAAPPPSPAPTPRPPRAKGQRNRLILVVVIVVVVVIIAAAVYVLVQPKSSSSTPPLGINCLNDKAGDWPTYLGEVTRNSQNCGASDLSSATAGQLKMLWSYNTSFLDPGFLQSEPIVTNGTVYIGGGNGVYYALNATTGQDVWESPNLGLDYECTVSEVPGAAVVEAITSSATVTGGQVYIGGGNGYFYVLNESTGAIDWSYYVGNTSQGYYNWASPLVLPQLGYVYIGVASNCDHPLVNGGLLQVSLSTHQLVRFFSDLDAYQQASCNNTAGPPFVENVSSGCGGSIWGSPSYDSATNTIWAVTGNGYGLGVPAYGDSLMEWDASSLSLVSHWTIPDAEEIYDGDFGTTPTLVNPVNETPMVFATDKNGWSYAFDRDNIAQGPVWQTQISTGTSVAPDAYGGGLIYIGGHSTTIGTTHYVGAIRAFNPAVNQTRWAVGMPGEVYGAPIYSNGLVVVVGGNLMDVLNSSTGDVVYSYTASLAFYGAPSIANGVIYVGNTNGLVMAFGLPGGTGASVAHSPSGAGPAVDRIAGIAAAVSAGLPIAQTVRRS